MSVDSEIRKIVAERDEAWQTIRELREQVKEVAQRWLNVSSECDELRPIKAERDELRSQVQRLEGELAKARGALKRYGVHHQGCEHQADQECSCGLSAARSLAQHAAMRKPA